MKNIVIIGGGTGTFTLLSGLRKYPVNNSVIVSTADDGGSTGRLREELGVVPPGDIRQCLVGLSYTDDVLKGLFTYRFGSGSLKGHNMGNIIIAALEKITGSIEDALVEAAKLLNVRGAVVPVTLFPTHLSATLKNGKKISGEHNIDESSENRAPIKGLQLKPSGPANPRALRLIEEADAIIFGPGDLFTSTIPNLLVKGIGQAINNSKAKKVLITNVMTKQGQTDDFKVSDFVKTLEKYLGSQLDVVIANTQKPKAVDLARYKKEKAKMVVQDLKKKVVAEPLLSDDKFKKSKSDKLKRSFLRHDPDKIAKIIYELLA